MLVSSWNPTTPGLGLCGAQWNPCSPELLAVVLSSGGLYVLEVKEDIRVIASDAQFGAASCELKRLLPLD